MQILAHCMASLNHDRAVRGFYPSLDVLEQPSWVGEKGFGAQYDDRELLLSHGRVVWAQLCQANTALFAPGSEDHPGALLFYARPTTIDSLSMLKELADRLQELVEGDEQPPEVLCPFVESMADRMRMDFNLPVPPELTEGAKVYYTCSVFHRRHLPGGVLLQSWFPYLVLPEKTKASLLLPQRFWPANLRRFWLQQDDEELQSEE